MEVDLSGYKIWDIYGTSRISLKGSYSKEKLISFLTDEWVPYIDCDRKCFRSPFCGFVKKDPFDDDRTLEVKCEACVRAVKYFVNYTFDIFIKLKNDNIQKYLDALFHYYQIVYYSETTIGGLLNEDSFEFMGQYAPASFGFIKNLRPHLDEYCNLLQNIPELWTKSSVIFVEGESEKAFIYKLKSTHYYDLQKVKAISYSGKSNRKIKRIEMLLTDYNNKGYEIYIQGDADGENQDIFYELLKRGFIKENNKFIFRHDFESSIPPCLLFACLQRMRLLTTIKKEDFIIERKKYNGSVIHFLHDKYDISLKKVQFAKNVAEIIVKSPFCWKNIDFQSTELGKFIHFVRTMY